MFTNTNSREKEFSGSEHYLSVAINCSTEDRERDIQRGEREGERYQLTHGRIITLLRTRAKHWACEKNIMNGLFVSHLIFCV